MLKLGLMGQHITKSLTQTFFQELLKIYSIELSYELFDMFNQNISIEEKLKELLDKDYTSLNITYPYKEEIFQYINSKSEDDVLITNDEPNVLTSYSKDFRIINNE